MTVKHPHNGQVYATGVDAPEAATILMTMLEAGHLAVIEGEHE